MTLRHATLALAPVVLIAVFLTASAHGQATGRDAVLSDQGRVVLLAADGDRDAVVTRVARACARRVVVWTAPARGSRSVKPGILGCGGDGISHLAVGGGQVGWIEQGGGN